MKGHDIVGLLVMEQSGVTSLGGSARSISELLMYKVQPALIAQAQTSLVDGGVLKFQIFEISSGDVLFEVVVDCKKPFGEILKFQPHD